MKWSAATTPSRTLAKKKNCDSCEALALPAAVDLSFPELFLLKWSAATARSRTIVIVQNKKKHNLSFACCARKTLLEKLPSARSDKADMDHCPAPAPGMSTSADWSATGAGAATHGFYLSPFSSTSPSFSLLSAKAVRTSDGT